MNRWPRSLRSLRSLRTAATLLLVASSGTLALAAAVDLEALYSKAEDLIRYTDDVNGVKALIRQGMDVKRASANSQGRTLLFTAASEAKMPMIDALLAAGADPDARDDEGMTALRHVAWTGKDPVAVTKRLLAAKADPNLRADDDWTPLIQAMYADAEVAVPLGEALLAGGADASVINDEGNSALTLAAGRGHVALIAPLVAAGAVIDGRDGDGVTALWTAARAGRTDVAEALLKAGADPDLGDEKNTTPLMKAAQGDFPEMVRLLLERCARRELADSFFHWTAMKFAKSDAVRQALQTAPGPACRR
jgi:ankyrin repeat protein